MSGTIGTQSIGDVAHGAVHLLMRASGYARDVGGDPWQFSIERQELELRGLDSCDLRWMMARGLIEQRVETTRRTDVERTFTSAMGAILCERSVFLITEAGRQELGFDLLPEFGLLGDSTSSSSALACAASISPPFESGLILSDAPATSPQRPIWCPKLRELLIGDVLVKRFRVPAPIQELILDAFEEENWPESILDPLPPKLHIDPKRRLQGAIKCLNRNQLQPALNFFGTGRGQEIGWQLLPAWSTEIDVPASRD